VRTDGGLVVETIDERFRFRLGGRLHWNAAFHREDRNDLGDGTEIRRARIEMEGRFDADWLFRFSVDFAGSDAEIKNAYLRYDGIEGARLTLGQFKEPFSLEALASTNDITFHERALPTAIAPGRKLGIGGRVHGDAWTGAAGVFGESYDSDPEKQGDEGWGVTGRVTFVPQREEDRVLHLGAALSWRVPGGDDTVRIASGPESHITDVEYVDTGLVEEVSSLLKYGLEAAAVLGPFSIQGEFLGTDLFRSSGEDDVRFAGWYVTASWVLTGESRVYRFERGAFGTVKPTGRLGAWEVALRYSELDLDDGPVRGGRERNVTLGVNWYVNEHLRALAAYTFVDNDGSADGNGSLAGDDDPGIFQIGAQLRF
jgi:phosphate-selective porin OprO/OprP